MIVRYAGSAVLAVGITFGLFLTMHTLIATGRNAIVEETNDVKITLTREERDEEPERIERKLPEKPEVMEEPDVPEMQMANVDASNTLNIGTPDLNRNIDTNFDMDAPADGDIMPIVRVPPQYPRNALSRGLEGYVILEFDVSKEGTTQNIRVVEADPKNIFDRAAINAVEKFKYKPRVVNGQPAVRYGVQFQMTFELADD